MAVDIHCYCETLNQAKNWEANNRHTFEIATAPGNDPWPEMMPDFDERLPALFGLLAMGINNTAYPFSFGQRGFPKNASEEVTKMFLANTEAHSASYLTREELEGKLGELMILPDQRALAVKPHLANLLAKLPTHVGDPKTQRIVFWFDGS